MTATIPEVDTGAPGPRRKALPSLTGMRFFAALLVFFIHSLQPIGPVDPTGPVNPFADRSVAQGLLKFFGPAGYLGVSFFFLLSGFVITWSVRPGERLTAYWRRRVVKIFPNHLVMWAAAMLLFASAYTPVSTWLPNLFLVNSWINEFTVQMSVNAPSWSLCSELLFYLSFPFLLLAVRRVRTEHLWWWAGGAAAATAGVALVTKTLLPDTPRLPVIPLSPTQNWFNYTFPPMRMFEFVLGMLLARLVIAGRWPRIPAGWVVALLAAGYAAAMYAPAPFNFVSVTVVPFGVAIASVARADVHGVRTRLDGRVLVWLGNVSFGFYLCQGVVIFWGRQKLLGNGQFTTPVAILVMIGMFAATLLGGWLLYACVEMPAMRHLSRSRAERAERAAARSAPADAVTAGAGTADAVAAGTVIPVAADAGTVIPMAAGTGTGTGTGTVAADAGAPAGLVAEAQAAPITPITPAEPSAAAGSGPVRAS
ncbi:acyltransferase family protein [Streptomyces sp. BBFR109]|uniref:acyltransferase family protein n=1 Tax=Streptomyces sp. BBFR109 TaxID=3448172 RepID=UPI003F76A523